MLEFQSTVSVMGIVVRISLESPPRPLACYGLFADRFFLRGRQLSWGSLGSSFSALVHRGFGSTCLLESSALHRTRGAPIMDGPQSDVDASSDPEGPLFEPGAALSGQVVARGWPTRKSTFISLVANL